MYQYHPANPFRPINWRWEQARVLRERRSKLSKDIKDDEWVADAFTFQREMSKCKDDVERWELMDKYPDLYGAYLIYKRGADEDRHPMRFAIEARILAGQNQYDISTMVGITTKMVSYYSNLFFDVASKLDNSDYIMTCVIGPSIQAGLSERDYDLLWKLFGYLYGSTILDSFIRTTSRDFRPKNLCEVDAALAEDARSALQRKVAVATRAFTLNTFSQSELLNIYARFLEIEKATDSGKAHDVILQNVQVMLDKLPWRIGDDKEDIPALAHYDTGMAELRHDELMLVSSGHELSTKEEVEGMKFPEPKQDGQQTK